MIGHVLDGSTQAGIGLHLFFAELRQQPLLQFGHHRSAVFLVERHALGWRHLFGGGVVLVDRSEGFQEIAAFLGEVVHHFHELPPCMGQAVGDDRAQITFRVGSQGITHLDGLGQAGQTLVEQVGQILPGMLHARDEQGHPVLAELRDQAGGVDALAFLLAPHAQLWAIEDLHHCVVLVDQIALRRVFHQGVQGRIEQVRGLHH